MRKIFLSAVIASTIGTAEARVNSIYVPTTIEDTYLGRIVNPGHELKIPLLFVVTEIADQVIIQSDYSYSSSGKIGDVRVIVSGSGVSTIRQGNTFVEHIETYEKDGPIYVEVDLVQNLEPETEGGPITSLEVNLKIAASKINYNIEFICERADMDCPALSKDLVLKTLTTLQRYE